MTMTTVTILLKRNTFLPSILRHVMLSSAIAAGDGREVAAATAAAAAAAAATNTATESSSHNLQFVIGQLRRGEGHTIF